MAALYEARSLHATSFGQVQTAKGRTIGTMAGVSWDFGSWSDVKKAIWDRQEIAKQHDYVQTYWSTFKNRLGQTIEKCVVEWYVYDGAGNALRCTDVMYINKGYRHYGV